SYQVRDVSLLNARSAAEKSQRSAAPIACAASTLPVAHDRLARDLQRDLRSPRPSVRGEPQLYLDRWDKPVEAEYSQGCRTQGLLHRTRMGIKRAAVKETVAFDRFPSLSSTSRPENSQDVPETVPHRLCSNRGPIGRHNALVSLDLPAKATV